MKRINWKSVLSVWIGAAILCAPALLNNFPFLYADTGTYVHGGFTGETSEIRPLLYGVFIRHISMHASLWFVILAQALMVSWSIHTFFRIFGNQYSHAWSNIWITVLVLMTGLGEVTGMLMPDIFTSVMILCGLILLFAPARTKWQTGLTCLFLWFSISVHHSNALSLFVVLISLVVIATITYWRKKSTHLSWKRFGLVFGIGLLGYFTIPTVHYIYGGGFYWSKAKNIFLTNRVNQMGLLKPFLRQQCAGHNYRLCADVEAIPEDLLWSADSPMRKSGGFAANDVEYGLMLKDFFKEPYFVKKFLIKTIENGVMQFFSFEGLVIIEESNQGYPYQVFEQDWPECIPPIRRSLQYGGKWDETLTQHAQRFLVFGSGILLIGLFVLPSRHRYTTVENQIACFILLGLAANAFICGGLSMVDVRFQYRVIWLVPLLAFLMLGNHGKMWWIEKRRAWRTMEEETLPEK